MYSYTCCDAHTAANLTHFSYNFGESTRDVFHGFWETDQMLESQCYAAFRYVDGGFDPRVCPQPISSPT